MGQCKPNANRGGGIKVGCVGEAKQVDLGITSTPETTSNRIESLQEVDPDYRIRTKKSIEKIKHYTCLRAVIWGLYPGLW